MKSLVHFPFPGRDIKLKVKVGDKINSETVLAEFPQASKLQIIPIAKIFAINGEKIPKYLKKNIGEIVKKGEVIAEKRQVFSQLLLKSPVEAKLKEIDLKKGTLTLEVSTDENEKMICPIPGRIKNISSNFIELEIDGEVYSAIGGSGKNVRGCIKYIQGERIGILDVTEEVGENILLCENISGELVAKLEVVGVLGLITCNKFARDIEIPYLYVSSDVFGKIKELDHKDVCLMPENKQLAIW